MPCWITSQNDTAPKQIRLQTDGVTVGLPVRTTLLQNADTRWHLRYGLDYQSERHCSKTGIQMTAEGTVLDYQSERHCSKTSGQSTRS